MDVVVSLRLSPRVRYMNEQVNSISFQNHSRSERQGCPYVAQKMQEGSENFFQNSPIRA